VIPPQKAKTGLSGGPVIAEIARDRNGKTYSPQIGANERGSGKTKSAPLTNADHTDRKAKSEKPKANSE
jgi:hypothetical protein